MIVGGRYRLQHVLGSGGMGTVHAAEDLLLGRRVALKLGHAEDIGDETIARRFKREAQIGTRVVHRNVAAVLDAGTTAGGVPYLAMEYASGRTLTRLVARRTMTIRRVAAIAEQLLAGLDAIHRAGFVHADMKSDNVIVDAEHGDAVKLIDLGLAHACIESPESSLAGSAAYMAPEVAGGSGSRTRSDIYAGGVIIYEMLVGHTPFGGLDPAEILHRQVHHEIAAPSQRSYDLAIPAGLDRAVMKALSKDASARFATASAFAVAIAAAVRHLPHDHEAVRLAAGTITEEWSRPEPTLPALGPISRSRGELARAIRDGRPDEIIATCLELVGAYLDAHRRDAAMNLLDHTLAILMDGRPQPAACWRLALPLAALYDSGGDHAKARMLARTAREQAVTSGSYLGTLRADELLARFAGRRHAVQPTPDRP